jgi:hypothetical protein
MFVVDDEGELMVPDPESRVHEYVVIGPTSPAAELEASREKVTPATRPPTSNPALAIGLIVGVVL